MENACIRHEHEYAFVHTDTGVSAAEYSVSAIQNTCIAGLLGSILQNILHNQAIHYPQNKWIYARILRIQNYSKDYLLRHVRHGLVWNYYPIGTRARVPNDLDDTSLALYSLSSFKNDAEIRSLCHKLIEQSSSTSTQGDHRINTWLNYRSDLVWFHEDITVLAHFGRLCNLYKIIHDPLISRIRYHIEQEKKSIFYVNNWWALYALSEWLNDTECLHKFYNSCISKEKEAQESIIRILCLLKLKQRGIMPEINSRIVHDVYLRITTPQKDRAHSNSIYYEKITHTQLSIAHSPLIALAIETEILFLWHTNNQVVS